jgi:hypothetical protein
VMLNKLERERITKRIKKAERRIAKGTHLASDKGREGEIQRMERLLKLLVEG